MMHVLELLGIPLGVYPILITPFAVLLFLKMWSLIIPGWGR